MPSLYHSPRPPYSHSCPREISCINNPKDAPVLNKSFSFESTVSSVSSSSILSTPKDPSLNRPTTDRRPYVNILFPDNQTHSPVLTLYDLGAHACLISARAAMELNLIQHPMAKPFCLRGFAVKKDPAADATATSFVHCPIQFFDPVSCAASKPVELTALVVDNIGPLIILGVNLSAAICSFRLLGVINSADNSSSHLSTSQLGLLPGRLRLLI